MRQFAYVAALVLGASTASAALIVQESFPYTAGGSLHGKSPAAGLTWRQAEALSTTVVDDLIVNSNSLAPTGPYALPAKYPAPSAGSVSFGGRGVTYVLPTQQFTSGTVYYSMLVQVSELSASATPVMIAGVSSSTASSTANSTNVGAALFGRPGTAAGTYQLGISRNAGDANASFSGDIPLGDTRFVVASYEFVTGTVNDVARLWINPSADAFGAAAPPEPPTLTGLNSGNDSLVRSFILYQRGGSSTLSVTGVSADEIRLGTEWADVTPVPEPASAGFLGLVGAALLRRRARLARATR